MRTKDALKLRNAQGPVARARSISDGANAGIIDHAATRGATANTVPRYIIGGGGCNPRNLACNSTGSSIDLSGTGVVRLRRMNRSSVIRALGAFSLVSSAGVSGERRLRPPSCASARPVRRRMRKRPTRKPAALSTAPGFRSTFKSCPTARPFAAAIAGGSLQLGNSKRAYDCESARKGTCRSKLVALSAQYTDAFPANRPSRRRPTAAFARQRTLNGKSARRRVARRDSISSRCRCGSIRTAAIPVP